MEACQNIQENVLHSMVQTPFSLFVYWDITQEYLALAKNSLLDVQSGLQLRIVRETPKGMETDFSHSITEREHKGSAYFYQLSPYCVYFAELGFFYHGGFFTLLRSLRTLTPPVEKVTSRLLSKCSLENKAKMNVVTKALPFAYSPVEKMSLRGD